MQYESPSQDPGLTVDQRLKLLYPMVNEEETPLPRSWSTKVTHLGDGCCYMLSRTNTTTSG